MSGWLPEQGARPDAPEGAEIHVAGDWSKDFEGNVERFARLGIGEYFAYDVPRQRLVAYQLPRGRSTYVPRPAQAARFHSDVLGLELYVDAGRLRFSYHDADVPGADDIIAKLQGLADSGMTRAEELQAQLAEERRLRLEEQQRREQEQQLREAAERRVAELEAELQKRS